MTEYRYEFGKRWDARTPRYDLKWLMGRVHVGTPDSEVETDIRQRCEKSGFPAKITAESVKYALICHHENKGLYRHVMRGSR